VDAGDDDNVILLLNQVELHSSNSAPIYILNAGLTTIVLADGTPNTITDEASYLLEDGDE
jgi:hypothetical protein